MGIIPTVKLTDDPILTGIQWSHSFAFSTSSRMNPVPIDLDLEPVDLTVDLTAVFLPAALPTAKVVNGALLLSFMLLVITALESN